LPKAQAFSRREVLEERLWPPVPLRGLPVQGQAADAGGGMSENPAIYRQVGGSHYRDMAIQPIEFCHRNRLGPCETLAIKYICRHQSKNGREDLEKAIHVLQMLMEFDYDEDYHGGDLDE
jgi:hypothetical protein